MSTETKWTPGPWELREGSYVWLLEVVCGDQMTIKVVTGATDLSLSDSIERQKNANLIAQAPRMYEALSAALPYLQDHDDKGPLGEGYQSDELMRLIEEAESALSQARGES